MRPSIRLEEIAEINPRFKESVESTTTVSFVPMAAVSDETRQIEEAETRQYAEVAKGYTPFQNDDVIVAKITPCFENGKMALVNIQHEYGFGSTEFHVIRADQSKIDKRYLYHFLGQRSVNRAGQSRMTGSAGQRRVPKSFFENLRIPLPPLDEQKRIAAVLDAADALRAKRRAALAKLDTLLQSVFLEMFGDPVTNPMGWPSMTLEELLSGGPQNGLYRPSSDYGSGTPIVRINSFYDGQITGLSDLKRVRIDHDVEQRYALRQDDILINRVNSREFLGKSAIVPPLVEPTVFESNMMRISINREIAHPGYVVAFLQQGFVKHQILRKSRDAVNQSSINQGDAKSLEIRVPPLDLQVQYIKRVEQLSNVNLINWRQLSQLDDLFSSLQQHYLGNWTRK